MYATGIHGIIGYPKMPVALRQQPPALSHQGWQSMPNLPQTQRCSKCRKVKPRSEFHKNAYRDSGLQNQCKWCVKSPSAKERILLLKEGMKRCSVCEEAKDLEKFYPDCSKKSGRGSTCIPCSLARSKEYREQNKEKMRARARRYYQENREEILEKRRQYWEENKEEIRAKNRQQHWENREERLEYQRQHYRQNPRMYHEHRLKRRALENNAEGYCSAEKLQARIDYYGGLCWMCGDPYEEVDHVIALARGGSNWPANLRPACSACNIFKYDKDWRQFAKKNGSDAAEEEE